MMRSREPTMTAPVRQPSNVTGLRYCVPHPMHLEIMGKSPHSFTVKDQINGSTMFNITRPLRSLHHPRVLNDCVTGNPILTLRKKIKTLHDRWQVFMGESTEHLLFSAKRPDIFQRNTELLYVYLANNPEEKNWDFKVEGCWSERSCVVRTFQSRNIVALMGKKHTIPPSNAFENDNFIVQVEAEVDHAFIVALIVILDEIN